MDDQQYTNDRKRPASSCPESTSAIKRPAISNSPAFSTDEELISLTDSEVLTCPICRELFQDPYFTFCGHTFCHSCITTHLEFRKSCPSCLYDLTADVDRQKAIIPNFTADKLANSIRKHAKIKKIIESAQDSTLAPDFSSLMRTVMESNLNADTLNSLIKYLTEKRDAVENGEKKTVEFLLDTFLREYYSKLGKDICKLEKVKEGVLQDMSMVTTICSNERSPREVPSGSFVEEKPSVHPSTSEVPTTETPDMDMYEKMRCRIQQFFPGLRDAYIDIRTRKTLEEIPMIDGAIAPQDTYDANVLRNDNIGERLGAFGEIIRGVVRYANVKRIATLNYDIEPSPQMSIVSSLEFDKDGEKFVVAGVTKRIKVFDYESVLEHPNGIHYPSDQLKCTSKISNVSWNPYQKHILACSDYDGCVGVWDVNQGAIVRNFQEHEKRCWTVNFNNVDPYLMASGSDDSKVKLWNMNHHSSVATIDAKVNVCCVTFSPTSRNHLVFGSADHFVHLYDIRNTSKAITVFRGHKKAVSYVRFVSSSEVVSASTDSSLRMWNTISGRCARVMTGHVNEKNFVGLGSGGDHIVCGSETNRTFFYHKNLTKPVAVFDFYREMTCNTDIDDDKEEVDHQERFVSSVCWRKDTDQVLVANSLGKVHVLKLS